MHLRILCAAALATLAYAAGQTFSADVVFAQQAGSDAAVRGAAYSTAARSSAKLIAARRTAKPRKAHAAKRVRPQTTVGERAARLASRYVGVPYAWGGSSPRHGFDCSGLVMYVYSKLGVSLPHHAASQFRYGRKVSRWGLKPGDLVFFSGLGHVGLFIGKGRFIDAPHAGAVVRVASLASRSSSFIGARRVSS